MLYVLTWQHHTLCWEGIYILLYYSFQNKNDWNCNHSLMKLYGSPTWDYHLATTCESVTVLPPNTWKYLLPPFSFPLPPTKQYIYIFDNLLLLRSYCHQNMGPLKGVWTIHKIFILLLHCENQWIQGLALPKVFIALGPLLSPPIAGFCSSPFSLKWEQKSNGSFNCTGVVFFF